MNAECTKTRILMIAMSALLLTAMMNTMFGPARADTEPNDDVASAEVIEPGTYTGTLNDTEDLVDNYRISRNAVGQTVYLNVTPGTGLSIDIYILDSNEYTKASMTNILAGDTGNINYTFNLFDTSTKNTYLRVSQAGGSGSYTMTVVLMNQSDAGTGADATDTSATATRITAGAYAGNFMKEDDSNDYFRINTTETGQKVIVNLTTDSTLSCDLVLLDSNDYTKATTSAIALGTTGRAEFTFADVQTVNIHVTLVTDTWGYYSLQVALVNENDINSGHDAGDAYTSAMNITAGNYTGNQFLDQDETDYYRINMSQTGLKIFVNVTFPTGMEGAVDLYDHDQYHFGNEFSASITGPATGRLYGTTESIQDLFIKVYRTNDFNGNYTMEVAVSTGSGGTGADLGITHTAVTSGTTGNAITITATVVSDGTVSNVKVNFTGTDGNFQNLTMDNGGSGTTYTGTIPAQASAGSLTYFIYADDSNSDTRTTIVYTVTITGTSTGVLPSISHTPVTAATIGTGITITAQVLNATNVVLFYRATGTSVYTSLNMTLASGSNYTAVIPGTAVTSAGIQYYIQANNTNGTVTYPTGGSASPTGVTASTATAPTITHTAITAAETGATITITATITNANSAMLYYRLAGASSYESATMNNDAGNTWSATIPGTAVTDDLEYYISATNGALSATYPTDGSTSPLPVSVSAPESDDSSCCCGFIPVAAAAVIALAFLLVGQRKMKLN